MSDYEEPAQDGWEDEEDNGQDTESELSRGVSESDDLEWVNEHEGLDATRAWRQSVDSLHDLGMHVRELTDTVAQATQDAAALCKVLQHEREQAKPATQTTASLVIPESYYKQ
jgi:hypothetical protein